MPTCFTRALGVVLALASGCLWPAHASATPAAGAYWMDLTEDTNPAAETRAVTGTLTLEQAMVLALDHNPTLKSFGAQSQAARAESQDSGSRSNPEMDVTVENFGSSNAFRLDAAEMTVAFSQSFGLGNKRGKRRNEASLAADVAACEYMQKKAALIADLRKAFLAVLADQRRRALAGEQLQLAQEVLAVVNDRAGTGRVSSLEALRSRTALATSRIAVNNTQRELDASRRRLALFWGSPMPLFEKVSGELEAPQAPLPDLQTLIEGTARQQDVIKCAAEVARQEAAVELCLAERMPDITVSGGVRHFEETGDNAMVAGLSVPLPLFNRNEGAVNEARHRLTAARAELQATRTAVVANLHQAHAAMLGARAEAEMLHDEVLPGARQTLAEVRNGFRKGRIEYPELFDARQAFTELSRAYVEALRAYQIAVIEMARWSGLDLPLSLDAPWRG